MKKISITTLGCKTNQFESEAILGRFINEGYTLVDLREHPDIIIINTCCVTNRAEYKSRYAIRKALERIATDGKVIVTGCYVNKGSSFFHKFKDRLTLYKNDQKHRICHPQDSTSQQDRFIELSTETYHLHTRVPVKIQDGCNFFCSYCILPYVRGKPISRSKDSIISQVQTLAENGVKEIILTGINLGLYGIDQQGYSLLDLLQDLVKTDISQIRLSSLEPMFFSNQMIDLFAAQDKICSHFHIPLQSGCDTVLRRMKRTYTTAEFQKIITNIHAIKPHAAIGCDVIVGFPGETEKEFLETAQFIEELPVTYLHVFRFSPRPQTKGAAMNKHVHGSFSKKRMQSLQKLSERKKNEYMKNLLSNKVTLRAVLETKEKDYWTSVSDHFVRIYIKDNRAKNGMLKLLTPITFDHTLDGLIVQELQHD